MRSGPAKDTASHPGCTGLGQYQIALSSRIACHQVYIDAGGFLKQIDHANLLDGQPCDQALDTLEDVMLRLP